MTEKIDNLEEELLNGVSDEKKSWETPSIIKEFVSKVKEVFYKNKDRAKVSEKQQFMISLSIFCILLVGVISWVLFVYMEYQDLEKKTADLALIQKYDIGSIKDLGYKESDKAVITINEMIEKYKWYANQNKSYEKYIRDLQAPYTYFLKYLYLPSFNIWKDNFTGELDVDIIGQKYLEKNPYEDTKLHSKWTNFFKNVGKNNEFNEIDSITIAGITPDKDNPDLFTVPIDINFTSNTKRSFLLLLNKLSMTSNAENVSLINEFVYYLWKSIKENKKEVLEGIKKTKNSDGTLLYSWRSDNKIIGYNLYQWVKNPEFKTDLVDDVLLDDLIPDLMSCETERRELCFYRFREKYSSLPTLAYTIWVEHNKNKKKYLLNFFSDINMLMKVENFTFDRIKSKESLFVNNNIKYKGSMKIVLYGQSVKPEEVEEISKKLGERCIKKPLSAESALEKVDLKIKELGEIWKKLKTSQIKKFWELKTVLELLVPEYDGYTNNKKAVKLFEIYRMLNNANICSLGGIE